MNQLSPELKRLMRWAREAPPQPSRQPPPGFAAGVIFRRDAPLSELAVWQNVIWRSAWAATALILLGVAVLTSHKLKPDSPFDTSPAYQVVSMKFIP